MDYFLKRNNFIRTATVYAANILLSFHFALIIYINSTYLEGIVGEQRTGLLYTIGSLLSILLFLLIPRIISRLGIFSTTFLLTILELCSVIVLGIEHNPAYIILFFLVHTAVISLLFYILDVYLETATSKEGVTGNVRGLYLTLTNLTLVAAPLTVGLLLDTHGYGSVYLISAAFLIPFIFLGAKWLRKFPTPELAPPSLISDTKRIIKNPRIFYPLFAQIILQLFFAFMVVYLPIYLITEIGFTWDVLGPVFTVMLIPYVLFELPAGYLADTKYGEKEFMIGGLILIGLTMIAITLPHTPDVVLWSVLLFLSRIGGSFTEITSETHFFRQVKGSDDGVISLFRLTRPLSYVIAAFIGSFVLTVASFKALFLVLATILILGAIMLLPMKDSR